MEAIIVEKLKHIYSAQSGLFQANKKEVIALNEIDFTVKKGEIFGILGPNGAGKTTTIKILTTLLIPTYGKVDILGNDIISHPETIRHQIGLVLGGDRGLYWRLSAYDNLVYFANLYHIPSKNQRNRIDYLLTLVGLNGHEREKVQGFSRGMKQRLHIARALLHNPEVLFLDEPSIGLDPVGAKEMRDMVVNLQKEGKTILLTTHYMFEADALCQRIAIFNHGKIVTLDTPKGIKNYIKHFSIVEVDVTPYSELIYEKVRELDGIFAVAIKEQDQRHTLHIQFDERLNITTILYLIEEMGGKVINVTTREATLEDAYLKLVAV